MSVRQRTDAIYGSAETRAVDQGRPSSRPTWRERLTAPGTRPWYFGAAIGVLWQGSLVSVVLLSPLPISSIMLGLAILAVLYVLFFLLGPVLWPEPFGVTLATVLGYWLVSCVLFPIIGVQTIWLWILVAALATFTGLPLRWTVAVAVAVVLIQLAITAYEAFSIQIIFAPIVTTVVSASMIAGLLLGRSTRSLRLAHDEIARLAVVEERARFGRDLHDVLGHSLTVVTVKSELARRLVRIDPDKAEAEIADIERLGRSALADLRVAVANYRQISIESELLAASTALSAAGITARFPADVTVVDSTLEGVFAWVLREGVTNVIRHSAADNCWVSLGADFVTIADNGRGLGHGAAAALVLHDGNGLRGLRERVAAVGASLVVGRSEHGGFELTARRP